MIGQMPKFRNFLIELTQLILIIFLKQQMLKIL